MDTIIELMKDTSEHMPYVVGYSNFKSSTGCPYSYARLIVPAVKYLDFSVLQRIIFSELLDCFGHSTRECLFN